MRVCFKCAPSVQVCGGDSRHGGFVCRGAPRALRRVVCRAPRARSSIGLSARLVSPCESRRRHGTRAPRRGAAPAIATASARARARKRLASSSPRTEACSRDQGSSCSAQRPDQSGRAWCACKRHTQWSRRGETRAGALALVGTSGHTHLILLRCGTWQLSCQRRLLGERRHLVRLSGSLDTEHVVLAARDEPRCSPRA